MSHKAVKSKVQLQVQTPTYLGDADNPLLHHYFKRNKISKIPVAPFDPDITQILIVWEQHPQGFLNSKQLPAAIQHVPDVGQRNSSPIPCQ
ncbi:hypothetical protein [Syntrophotalea carbinolica]|uniref:hypothetical protein n=1 Tax=Syntrophotalea carbinolica TaxID=19 RepID=UPI0005A16032|nr:hypothetical protein [Syntrophotalea carbinolica]